MSKQLKIDFLYLDLNTCERCTITDSSLNEALAALSSVLDVLHYEVKINKINIHTRALAEQYRFLSSPTIRVNGLDICGSVTENSCCSCGAICGSDVNCRTFVYEGKTYEQPPIAMMIDGILRAIYSPSPHDETVYMLPNNLERFFAGCDQINLTKEGIYMKKMQIFEPAMCCPTGLCGVGVDPELLRISTVINTLKQNHIVVERFNLNTAPMEFVNNAKINAYINEKGPEGLPAVTLDGNIILAGRYPTNEEFTEYLELPADLLGKTPVKENGCNCEGGCC